MGLACSDLHRSDCQNDLVHVGLPDTSCLRNCCHLARPRKWLELSIILESILESPPKKCSVFQHFTANEICLIHETSDWRTRHKAPLTVHFSLLHVSFIGTPITPWSKYVKVSWSFLKGPGTGDGSQLWMGNVSEGHYGMRTTLCLVGLCFCLRH